jgi:hypothetical protein
MMCKLAASIWRRPTVLFELQDQLAQIVVADDGATQPRSVARTSPVRFLDPHPTTRCDPARAYYRQRRRLPLKPRAFVTDGRWS